ncbi:MAG TPA: thioredoxin domain-containing protein [Patescibacteria group bacterium]|nr:thioredoxin domain-containing protein [Patescibacteria group bacterium]
MRREGLILGGIGLITLVIVVGAAFFLSSPQGVTPNTPAKVVDTALLYGPEKDRESMGSPSAKVAIVEFGDFECPACGAAHPAVKRILADYKGRIYFIFRNFPLPMHPNAPMAAEAAYAAFKQDKFWQLHDQLYEAQDEWGEKSATDAKNLVTGYVQSLGLNMTQFTNDLNSNAGSAKIQKDQNDGYQLGVDSTPTFFINGEKFAGVMTYDQLKQQIDDHLK